MTCRRRIRIAGTSLALVLCASSAVATEPSASRATPGPAGAQPAPRPQVLLNLADPSPVIGVTGETELSIEVTNPPIAALPLPRVLCSVGQIEDLGREGPNRFTARYILPAGRFPQPAILVAEFATEPEPLRAMVAVRLRAATTFPLRTDPGANVTLRVGDRDFGPQSAGEDGSVRIPIVVPPGVDSAVARSVNRYGVATEQLLDLHVPYSQRVLVAAPEIMAAGTTAEVAVYAVDPSGQPADASAVTLRAAARSRVQPLGTRVPGEARFLVTAPAVLRRHMLRIEAQLKGQSTTRTTARIALVAANAAGLTIEPEAPYLEPTSQTPVRVFLGAEDAYGNPVDASPTSVTVDAKPVMTTKDSNGQDIVLVATPSPIGQRKEVVVEGVLDDAHAVRRIPIGARWPAPKPPLRPPAVLSPRYTIAPRMGVLWNLAYQAGVTLLVDATAYPSRRDPGLGVGLSLGLLETWFATENAGGISHTSLTTVPALFQLHQLIMSSTAFVGCSAGAGFALAFSRIRSDGGVVRGASYGFAADVRVEGGFLLRRGHLVASLHYLAVYLADFSSGDRVPGNSGGAVADLGYRFVW
jgi:hypothetical protein